VAAATASVSNNTACFPVSEKCCASTPGRSRSSHSIGPCGQSKQRDRRPKPDSDASVAAQSPRAASTVRAAPSISGLEDWFTGNRSRRKQISDNVVSCSAYSRVTPALGESKGTLLWLTLDGSVAPLAFGPATV